MKTKLNSPEGRFPHLRQIFTLPRESPLEEQNVHWGYKDIAKLVGLYFSLLVLMLMVNQAFFRTTEQAFATRFALINLATIASVVVAAKRYRYWPGIRFFRLSFNDFREQALRGLVTGVIFKALPTLVFMLLLMIASLFGPMPENASNNPLPTSGGITLAWLITALDISVLTPLVEEYVFRGLLYGLLRNRYGVARALLFSSLVFGLLHGVGYITIVTALAGLGYALVYERTGSLAPAVIAHGVGNLITVLITALQM